MKGSSRHVPTGRPPPPQGRMHWHPATRAYAPAHEEGGGWLGGCGTPPPPLPPPRPALRPAAAPPPRCKRPPQPARCARGRPAPGRGGGGACGARRLSLPRGRGGGGGVVVVAQGGGSGLPFLLRHARGDTAGGRRGGVCLKRPWLCGWRGGGGGDGCGGDDGGGSRQDRGGSDGPHKGRKEKRNGRGVPPAEPPRAARPPKRPRAKRAWPELRREEGLARSIPDVGC